MSCCTSWHPSLFFLWESRLNPFNLPWGIIGKASFFNLMASLTAGVSPGHPRVTTMTFTKLKLISQRSFTRWSQATGNARQGLWSKFIWHAVQQITNSTPRCDQVIALTLSLPKCTEHDLRSDDTIRTSMIDRASRCSCTKYTGGYIDASLSPSFLPWELKNPSSIMETVGGTILSRFSTKKSEQITFLRHEVSLAKTPPSSQHLL